MSQLTLALMGRNGRVRSTAWPGRLALVADRLVEVYGRPSLGNFKDPIKEVFYILLSARTTERLYQRAHRKLFQRFGRLETLASANAADVCKCVQVAGLGTKRAAHIVQTAKILSEDFGTSAKRRLRRMPPSAVYAYLRNLPGLGPKSALCIMMYSLDIDVFPVDVNVQRILERLGALRKHLKHYQAQRLAPALVPTGRSKDLHIGLVEHGRKVCMPQCPKCDSCVLSDLCRRAQARMKRRRNGVAH